MTLPVSPLLVCWPLRLPVLMSSMSPSTVSNHSSIHVPPNVLNLILNFIAQVCPVSPLNHQWEPFALLLSKPVSALVSDMRIFKLSTFTGVKSVCSTPASRPTFAPQTLVSSITKCLVVNTPTSWYGDRPFRASFFYKLTYPFHVSSKLPNWVSVLSGQVSSLRLLSGDGWRC